MSPLALSVLLSLVSAVCYAGAAVVQERVATTGGVYAQLRNRGWWYAVTLNGSGAALHVAALAYGPLSIVQPLGALTIVLALPMAAVFTGRPVKAAGWRGAVLTTTGLVGLLALTGSTGDRNLSDTGQLVLGVAAAGVIAVLAAAGLGARRPAVRGVLQAVAAGIAFGVASVFIKAVAVGWEWDAPLAGLPALLMITVLATAGMLLSQAAYRSAGLALPLATLGVVNPVVAAAIGVAVLGEHFRFGLPGTILAMGAGVVAIAGLVTLTVDDGGKAAPEGRAPARRPVRPEPLIAAGRAPASAVPAGTPPRAGGSPS